MLTLNAVGLQIRPNKGAEQQIRLNKFCNPMQARGSSGFVIPMQRTSDL